MGPLDKCAELAKNESIVLCRTHSWQNQNNFIYPNPYKAITTRGNTTRNDGQNRWHYIVSLIPVFALVDSGDIILSTLVSIHIQLEIPAQYKIGQIIKIIKNGLHPKTFRTIKILTTT